MASLASLQKRYQRGLDNSDFYAAEQACRMMHHRLTQGKNATDQDRARAATVVIDGAKSLLSHSQIQAGTALAILATKHYVDHTTPVSDDSTAPLEAVATAYDAAHALNEEGRRERLRFLRAALAWSSRRDCSGFAHGHVRLNRLTAHAAAEAGDYDLAQRLFIHSADPIGAADVLAAFADSHALPSEKGLVMTRTVLRFLVSENIADAVTFRKRFAEVAGWPSAELSSSRGQVPLLANFSELIVKICQLEASAAALFERVCLSYKSELQRDPSFEGLLAKIGTMYFNIAPPQPGGMAGMMGNLLRGMMNT